MGKIPGIDHLDAVRALKKAGFKVLRQGKHIVMSDGLRIITIPSEKMSVNLTISLSWPLCRVCEVLFS